MIEEAFPFRNSPKKEITKICEFCKEEFVKNKVSSRKEFAGQKFCSKTCTYKAQSKRMQKNHPSKICPFCKNPFNKRSDESSWSFKTRRKFCSKECRYKAESQRHRKVCIPKICQFCKKEFTKGPNESSWYFRKRRKFCTKICVYDSSRKGSIGSDHYNQLDYFKNVLSPRRFVKESDLKKGNEFIQKLEFPCANSDCLNVTYRTPAKAKQAKHHFCSKKCSSEWLNLYNTGNKYHLGHQHKPETIAVMKQKRAMYVTPKGKNSPNYGKKQSEISRLRKSLSLLGKAKSENHRQNIALAKMGDKNPMAGKIPHNYKIPPTPETIDKLRKKKMMQEITTSEPEKWVEEEFLKRKVQYQKNLKEEGRTDFSVLPNLHLFVDGDFHHANPERYKAMDRVIGNKIAEDIWRYDAKITKDITDRGGQVMRFWQSELEKDLVKCIDMFLTGEYITMVKEDGTRRHVLKSTN